MVMNKTLKRYFKGTKAVSAATAAVALTTLINTQSAMAQVLDRVAAVVNEDVVMLSEVNERLKSIQRQFAGNEAQLPPQEILLNQIIDRLVIESLQLSMARRAGLDYSDQEVDQSIARIAAGNNMNPDQFRQALAADGQNWAEFRAQVKKEMQLNAVKQGVLSGRVTVTEAEIDNFLRSEEGQLQTADSYRVSHVMLSISSRASNEEIATAETKANEIYERAVKGDDFGSLAITYSNAQDALSGGDLGWRRAGELPTVFADKVVDLSKGDVVPVFRTGAGFHIIKLMDKRGPTKQIVKQTKVRHILVTPNEIRDEEQSLELANDIYKRVENGEDFAALAKEFSDDAGTKQSGGDLGWAMPGQFVPAFEETMGAAKIGETSMPFRSQFGWHILQVEDRRDEDMSERYLRGQAANMIRQRKMDAEQPRWLQELKDDAFIDIRLNKEIDPNQVNDGDA